VAWRDLFRWGQKALGANDILRELALRYRSRTGKSVTLDTAISVSTVFACCRVIGNGMAQVPFKLMRESPDGKTRMPAKDHPLYALMAFKPNPWQTSYEFRETVSWHLELCLEAFVFVNRSVVRGRILELIPIEPSCVKVNRAPDHTLTYEVRGESGESKPFPASAIWHIRGPSWNGYRGMDFLKAARDAIGLAMAAEESQGELHRNGVRTGNVYAVEGTLKDGQYKALREWLDREHVGAGNAGRPMILDRGAKWLATQMTGVDAQHLETRRFQIEDICRFFGVMPIMVGYSDKAVTYASAEQMFLAHAVHGLAPRWTRFEQSADAALLTEAEIADGYYFDFVEEGMIRGAAKDTKDVILGYVNGGVMTPNEGRGKLDLNPDPDPASDKLRIPVNTAQEPKPDDETPDGGAKPAP
jgi:HK97 family phage portal protein